MTFLQEQEKVKPFYGELQGYLEMAPKDDNQIIHDKAMWEQVNSAIDLLNQAQLCTNKITNTKANSSSKSRK